MSKTYSEEQLIIAFIQGADWSRWILTGFTPFYSEREESEAEARKRLEAGKLWKSSIEIMEEKIEKNKNV